MVSKNKSMKQAILTAAKCIAWGIVEVVSYTARHPWSVIVAIIITILLLKLQQAISVSLIYN